MKFSLFSLTDIFLPPKKKKFNSRESVPLKTSSDSQAHRPRSTSFRISSNAPSHKKVSHIRSFLSQSSASKLRKFFFNDTFSFLSFLKLFCKFLPLIIQLVILVVSLLSRNYTFALFAGLGLAVTFSYHINHIIDTYLRNRSSLKENKFQSISNSQSKSDNIYTHLLFLLKKMPSIPLPLLNDPLYFASHFVPHDEHANGFHTTGNLSPATFLHASSFLQSPSSLSQHSHIMWKHSLRRWITHWKLFHTNAGSLNYDLSSYISTSLTSLRVASGIYSINEGHHANKEALNRNNNLCKKLRKERNAQDYKKEGEFALSPLYIDLIHDGPHALIGGTTGSGKSIFLQSWCSALAFEYSPLHLNFIFLDFKGGSTFTSLSQLPHVVGTVSDLNLGHAKRAFRAIEAELLKREHLILNYKVQKIDELPFIVSRLVIVIDEFQALKSLLPDFHERIHRIAAQGRSLGIHLILSTQSPGFQVNSEMRANFNLRICFRVQEKIQSSELIGNSSASYIPNEFPGSAYVKFNDRTHIFKSAICDPDSVVSSIKTSIAFGTSLALSQAPFPPLSHTNTYKVKEKTNSLAQGTNLLSLFCKKSSPLFSNTLQRVIPLSLTLEEQKKIRAENHLPLGIVDTGICLKTYYLSLNNGNIAIIGGSGRGKTHIFLLLKYYLSHFSDMTFTEDFSSCTIDNSLHSSLLNQQLLSSPPSLPHNDSPTHLSRSFSLQNLSSPSYEDHKGISAKCKDILLCDDSDSYFDPLYDTKEKQHFHTIFNQGKCIFSTRGAPPLKYLENCGTKIIFPCGDPSIDSLNGISQKALYDWETEDFTTAGRALIYDKGGLNMIQIFSPPEF